MHEHLCEWTRFVMWKWCMWQLIKHGSRWINFIIHNFISEKKRYYEHLYKFWTEFISFDMKKRWNFKIGLSFVKENVSLGSFINNQLCLKWDTPIVFDPIISSPCTSFQNLLMTFYWQE